MSNKFQARVANKNDIAENWAKAENFQPLKGEIIIYNKDEETPTPKMKIGDGVTPVNELPFFRGECIGEETEEGGILLHEVGTNQALAQNTLAAGNDNWAGYYGFRIIDLKIPGPIGQGNLAELLVQNVEDCKAYECYSAGDIVQMHLTSHYHDRYEIFDIDLGNPEGTFSFIRLKPTYGDIVTDSLTLVSEENNTEGTRNWLYVIGKPYGEPMKYSKGATTFGNHNIVTGQGALGVGNWNEVLGHAALAAGSENKVGYAGFASGVGNKITHNRAAGMGYGLKSGRVNQVLAGMYNEVEENAMFVVGGGTGDAASTRKTVFKVENNGDIYGKRDLKVEGEIQYKDVNLTEKMKDVDYQLASPDRYKIVDELPDLSDATNYSDIYLVNKGYDVIGANIVYDKYIQGDIGDNKTVESSTIWDGTLIEPIQNDKGQYEIDSAEKLAYVIYYGGTIGENVDCDFIITKDIYLNDINKVNWATGTAISGYKINKWYTDNAENNALKINKPFGGSIDGRYHTIYGIYCPYAWSYSPPTASNNAAALIAKTSTSLVKIKNLKIDNSFIKVRGHASALVGATYGPVEIDNCGVGANVYLGGYSASAIRGAGRADASSAIITNCYSLANTNLAGGNGNLPTLTGICGYFWDKNIEITSCFNANGPITTMEYGRLRIKDCYAIDNPLNFEGVVVLTVDSMQGLDVLTNPNKMPLLEKLHMFKATESYPTYKFATFGWIKIDDSVTREYVRYKAAEVERYAYEQFFEAIQQITALQEENKQLKESIQLLENSNITPKNNVELFDQTTRQVYKLYINDGKLQMEVAE